MLRYKGYYFHPYSHQISDGVCPFCKYDGKKDGNYLFTIHMRRCFLDGLKDVENEIFCKKEQELFAKYKR